MVIDGEGDDQQRPEPEAGHGDADEGEESRQVVDPRIAIDRGDDAERERHQQSDEHRSEGQLDRGRIARRDLFGHVLVGLKRSTEVAANHAAQIVNVLGPKRLVEAERLSHLLHILRPRILARDLQRRISGDQMDEREHEGHDSEGDRNHLQETAEDVLHHVLRAGATFWPCLGERRGL